MSTATSSTPDTTSASAPKKRRGCLWQGGRILLILFVLLLALAAGGAVYESVARSRDLAQVSPPGQLVDVGGYKLHIHCLGERQISQPTVILEAGSGGWSMHWYDFHRQAARFVRTCAYDRAGFGWSEAGPQPREGDLIARELHTLLAGAGEAPPYLLVGASRGGQYVRIYRDVYPEEVVGLVLVDGEPEDFSAQAALARQAAAQNVSIFSLVGGLSRIGLFRIWGGDPASAPEVPCIPFLVKDLPAAEHGPYLAVEGQPACFDALLGEERATVQREARLRQAAPLGDLPLVVLSHGLPTATSGTASAAQAAEAEEVWQSLQQKQATLSTRGRLVQAAQSGHNIALDQPELVLDAIRQIIE